MSGGGWLVPPMMFVSSWRVISTRVLQLSLRGGADLSLSRPGVAVTAALVSGDVTGRLTVRRGQTYSVTSSHVLLPHALLAQRRSRLNLPPVVDCRDLDVVIKGQSPGSVTDLKKHNFHFTLQTSSNK